MRILVVGDWHSELHEEVVYHAFNKLGHEVHKFAWHNYFKPATVQNRLVASYYKAQNKYLAGPVIAQINRELISAVEHIQPDMMFVYRGTHIFGRTIDAIRQISPKTKILGYNNDDPFSKHYPKWQWRHFLGCVPKYDLVLAYRKHNIPEFYAAGAKRVELLRSWFVPERNFPNELNEAERARFKCDVVFVGHFEDDFRIACLEEVVRRGWHLRLFGPEYGWDSALRTSSLLCALGPVRQVWGNDYNNALCGAKVALSFFSKLNRDTYTRRCFEIPATGTAMLCEYSDDAASLFESGKQAEFFRSPAEMGDVLDELLNSASKRSRISNAGLKAVWDDGHDVTSRMKNVLDWVAKLPGSKT